MSKGLSYVMGDTDGLKFCKPDMSPFTKDEIDALTTEINAMLPELLYLEDDGYFEELAIIKTKNYITKEDGKVKLKGSGLTDQKKERALLDMVRDFAESLIEGINYKELTTIYHKYITEVMNMTDIKRWSQKKTVTKAILNCENDPEARANESKVWDAIQGMDFQEGDKIWVYDSQDGEKQKMSKGEPVFLKSGKPSMVPNFILKTVENYDNDHVEAKLLKRCYDTVKIFKTVIDEKQFINYSLTKNLKLAETFRHQVIEEVKNEKK